MGQKCFKIARFHSIAMDNVSSNSQINKVMLLCGVIFRNLRKKNTFITQIIDNYYFATIGILFPKLFWPLVRNHCSSDLEKRLKFKAEGREFSKFLRSLKVRVNFRMNLWSHRFSQNTDKKLSKFLPSLHRAEILTIFHSNFGRNSHRKLSDL